MVKSTNEEAVAGTPMSTSAMAGHESTGEPTFMNKRVFQCSNSEFTGCYKGRKKNQKWKTVLSGEALNQVKDWKKKSPKNKDFILKNSMTGAMFSIS